jgi:hypothetical protein
MNGNLNITIIRCWFQDDDLISFNLCLLYLSYQFAWDSPPFKLSTGFKYCIYRNIRWKFFPNSSKKKSGWPYNRVHRITYSIQTLPWKIIIAKVTLYVALSYICVSTAASHLDYILKHPFQAISQYCSSCLRYHSLLPINIHVLEKWRFKDKYWNCPTGLIKGREKKETTMTQHELSQANSHFKISALRYKLYFKNNCEDNE